MQNTVPDLDMLLGLLRHTSQGGGERSLLNTSMLSGISWIRIPILIPIFLVDLWWSLGADACCLVQDATSGGAQEGAPVDQYCTDHGVTHQQSGLTAVSLQGVVDSYNTEMSFFPV